MAAGRQGSGRRKKEGAPNAEKLGFNFDCIALSFPSVQWLLKCYKIKRDGVIPCAQTLKPLKLRSSSLKNDECGSTFILELHVNDQSGSIGERVL